MNNAKTLKRSIARGFVLLAVMIGLAGCSGHFPADPDVTLDKDSGGTPRVGIPDQPHWTDTDSEGNDEQDKGGTEVALETDYAQTINADVEWHTGGEEQLIMMLSGRELDMVIGGLTDESPWSSDAALTTTFAESIGVDDSTSKHVMAVQMGENAFMTSLEEFLLDQNIDQIGRAHV